MRKGPLAGVQPLTEWPPRYQLVHLISRAIHPGGVLTVHVPHAASLGNPNRHGHLWPPRLFTRVAPSCVIHTTRMVPCDLGFPPPLGVLLITYVCSGTHLSWSNSVVWIIDARCHIGLTVLPRTRRHILVIDVRPLIDTLARATCGTLTHAACGTRLAWPTMTSSQRCSRTGRYRKYLTIIIIIETNLKNKKKIVSKMVSNLVTIATNYFLSLKLIFISWFSCNV